MNKYKLYFFILFIFLLPFSIFAQQLNPPRLLNVKVLDPLGLPISFATLSIDFKVIGLTNQNGEFTFENKGGLLSISKVGYISKIIQIPNYWQGTLNINLSSIDYENIYENKIKDEINYKVTIYLNNSPLIKEKVIVLENSSMVKTYYTNENGELGLKFRKKSEIYLIYINNKQNNLYIYFSKLKESDNGSLIILNYNVYDYLMVNLKDNILADNIIIKNKYYYILIPIINNNFNLISPYRVYFGSNDYEFFNKYELFFNFLLPSSFYIKSIQNDIIKNTLISMIVNYKEAKIITKDLFENIINTNIKQFNIIDFFNDFNDRCKYNFNNEGFFELSYKKGNIDLIKLRLYDINKNLILESYFSTYVKIPNIFFEKEYSLIVEFYPNLFYDNLLVCEVLLSKNSYYGLIVKLP